jgi:hypothetical protein
MDIHIYSFSILGDIDPGTLSLNGHDNIEEFIYIYIYTYLSISIFTYMNTYICM